MLLEAIKNPLQNLKDKMSEFGGAQIEGGIAERRFKKKKGGVVYYLIVKFSVFQ